MSSQQSYSSPHQLLLSQLSAASGVSNGPQQQMPTVAPQSTPYSASLSAAPHDIDNQQLLAAIQHLQSQNKDLWGVLQQMNQSGGGAPQPQQSHTQQQQPAANETAAAAPQPLFKRAAEFFWFRNDQHADAILNDDAMSFWSMQGELLGFNSRFRELLGRDDAELQASFTLCDVYGPQQQHWAQRSSMLIKEIVGTRFKSCTLRTVWRRKDGTIFAVRNTFHFPSGAGFFWVCHKVVEKYSDEYSIDNFVFSASYELDPHTALQTLSEQHLVERALTIISTMHSLNLHLDYSSSQHQQQQQQQQQSGTQGMLHMLGMPGNMTNTPVVLPSAATILQQHQMATAAAAAAPMQMSAGAATASLQHQLQHQPLAPSVLNSAQQQAQLTQLMMGNTMDPTIASLLSGAAGNGSAASALFPQQAPAHRSPSVSAQSQALPPQHMQQNFPQQTHPFMMQRQPPHQTRANRKRLVTKFI